jgi:hypothetical protein
MESIQLAEPPPHTVVAELPSGLVTVPGAQVAARACAGGAQHKTSSSPATASADRAQL